MARKNLLKIPSAIRTKIAHFKGNDVVVACVKTLRPEDVARYAHLGLKLENGELVLPPPRVPLPTMGRYSDANVHGKEVKRKDLPKVQKTYSWDTPNWGDWSYGSHTQSMTRDVYQRDFMPPKEIALSVTLIEKDSDTGTWVLKFAIDQVLSRKAKDFEADLLYNLNILQENVQAVDVFASTATLADYVSTIRVDWEILPPGTVAEVMRRMLEGKEPVSAEKQGVMKERLSVLNGLKPVAYVAGTNEFLRYFGAKFGEDFVVFENLNYGNAIYIMYEKWESLSRRSRIDLLKGPSDGFERIEHREGWEERLEARLKAYRNRRDT